MGLGVGATWKGEVWGGEVGSYCLSGLSQDRTKCKIVGGGQRRVKGDQRGEEGLGESQEKGVSRNWGTSGRRESVGEPGSIQNQDLYRETRVQRILGERKMGVGVMMGSGAGMAVGTSRGDT